MVQACCPFPLSVSFPLISHACVPVLSISFRHKHPELRRTSYVTDNDIQWHGEAAFKPDWSDSSRLVAYTLKKQAPAGG